MQIFAPKPPPWQAHYPLLTPAQLAAEQGLMKRSYPQFRLVGDGNQLSFQGPLVSNYGSCFHVEIRLPTRYPEEEPQLWMRDPVLPADTEHRYKDGRICAHAEPFVAYRTTVASMVSVFAGWIFRFERKRLHGVSWEVPIEVGGRSLQVNPNGTLYLA